MAKGMVYNIQRMSTEDGPGLRTTVFLKGCPLRCLWCSNPESQAPGTQLMVFENLCTGCGNCEKACPAGAVVQKDGIYNRDMALCTDCGACVPGCPSKARVMSGTEMEVEDVMKIVRKDSLYYGNSDGGVTIGGGEPTAAGEFLIELLQACRDEGYHTCVDTCGFCPEERFAKVIPLADLFLFDCKHMDPAEHKRYTAQENGVILANLRAALQSKTEVRIRMPLMPGWNDTRENIAAMAAFLKPLGKSDVDVMPCHAFGRNKYAALNMQMSDMGSYTPEALAEALARFTACGLTAHVV